MLLNIFVEGNGNLAENKGVEHNKDRPAGDLYPNLQVIKFLEADHDPQVLNPF
jgi:hypothetical protein